MFSPELHNATLAVGPFVRRPFDNLYGRVVRPGVKVIKLSFFVCDDKGQRVCPWKPFPVRSQNLRARPEPMQLERLSDASFLGMLLVLQANVRIDWKVIARYKHDGTNQYSTGLFVNYSQKNPIAGKCVYSTGHRPAKIRLVRTKIKFYVLDTKSTNLQTKRTSDPLRPPSTAWLGRLPSWPLTCNERLCREY